VLKRWGVEMARPWLDTMLAAFALDTTRNVYGLDRLARDFLGYQTIAYTDLIPKGQDATLADRDIAAVTDYAAEDADITLQLADVLEPRLAEAGLASLLSDLDMPAVKVLGDMELTGTRLLPQVLRDFSVELEAKLVDVERSIYQAVGHEFNIGSTRQLQQILFEERKLKPIKKTKTGYSTDADVLEELAREDEVCAAILQQRNLTKLKSTYVDTLPTLVNARTGRLHTHYDQTGAATGRLASTDPNLQNIPVRDELGRRIRSAFVAEPGWTLLSADYSQIELVILAARSGDELLCRAFREGRDIHTQTAALLFGAMEGLVTAEMRRIGKTINFGVIYGMSAFRLSRETGIPRKDAETFIRTYFERFGGVTGLIERSIMLAKDKGYVTTLRGRRRPIPAIHSSNHNERAGAERIAVNTPIQGTAADIVKMAMVAIARALVKGGYRARLLLQVHDELILEVPDGEIEDVSRLVRHEMESVVDLGVPLRVGLKTGRSWGDID
jgi:DNA polymerase I